MFGNSGLSLNQAPPIEVVLRFFLTGALFGVVASFMLIFWHQDLSSVSAPTTLAIVHTFTLGVMASFMLGALFQMMPVLCGVHINAPIDLAIRVNFTLIFGVIFLIVGFIKAEPTLYILASLMLGYSLFVSSFIMIKRLFKIEHSNSSRGMLLAIVSLALTALFGIVLLAMRTGYNPPLDYLSLKAIHFNFGVFGWITMLIISVSFQVVEMFYVTPKYNQKYSKYITISIFALLMLYMVITILKLKLGEFLPYILVIIVAIHSATTLVKLKQKRRALNDASIWFWVIGMVSLGLFFVSYLFGLPILLTSEFFLFFGLSIVYAMSYKIVPFLVWFHLNAKGYFDAPMMHEVISPKYAKINLYVYLLSIATLLLSIKFSEIFYIGSFLLLLSFSMLSLSIYNGWQKYNNTLKFGKKFNI